MLNPYSETTGLPQASGALQNALRDGRASHAYLFAGPEEAGQAAARAFAMSLLCEAPVAGKACGLCRSCRLVPSGAHPDFQWVRPEGSSIKIQQIRDIQRSVAFRPFHGGRKLTVIDQADKMTIDAANCLLKTLEEPPPAVHFILLTSRSQRLPATIVSRCQCLNFGDPPRESGADFSAGFHWPEGEDELGTAADAAYPGDGPGGQSREEARRIAAVLAEAGVGEALAEGEAAAKNREQAQNTLETLTGWYRDLLIWREAKDSALLFHPERLAAIKEDSGNYETGALINIIEEIERTRKDVAGNTNVRLLTEGLFLKINRLLSSYPIGR